MEEKNIISIEQMEERLEASRSNDKDCGCPKGTHRLGGGLDIIGTGDGFPSDTPKPPSELPTDTVRTPTDSIGSPTDSIKNPINSFTTVRFKF